MRNEISQNDSHNLHVSLSIQKPSELVTVITVARVGSRCVSGSEDPNFESTIFRCGNTSRAITSHCDINV